MAKISNDWNEELYNKAFEEYNAKAGGKLYLNDLDKQTALKDKNFALATFQNKTNYINAQNQGDTAKMQEANNAQNANRRQYGYTLGSDGNTPTFYNDPKLNTEITTEKPADYVSKYKNKIDSLYNEIANSKFDYDLNSDQNYQNYKAEYTRNAQRAMQDTLGETIGSSGFAGSSYATATASQAYDYQMSQLNDKVPELYQQAYSRYQDEIANKNQNLNTLMSLDNNDYSKYRDAISDYYNDRDFEWGQNVATYNADVYTSETQKSDARYEAEQIAAAQEAMRNYELSKQELAESIKNGNFERAYKLAELMGYDENGNYTLAGRKANNDYNIALLGKENDRLKIDNDFIINNRDLDIKDYTAQQDAGIGWANAETNRQNANTNSRNADTNALNAQTNATKVKYETLKEFESALDNIPKSGEYTTLDMNGKQITKNKYTDEEIAKERYAMIQDAYQTGVINENQVAYYVSKYNLNKYEW